jgi:hypothetical protein
MRIAVSLWTSAILLRPLKHVVPLPVLVRLMRPRQPRDDRPHRDAIVRELATYLSRRGPIPFRAPGNCLERSLGAYRLLCSASADPHLVIGVRASSDGVDGHVWIELDGQLFGDDPARVAGYAPIASFNAHGDRDASRGPIDPLRGIRWA